MHRVHSRRLLYPCHLPPQVPQLVLRATPSTVSSSSIIIAFVAPVHDRPCHPTGVPILAERVPAALPTRSNECEDRH